MPDPRTFWATKSPLPEYEAITFTNPAFDAPIRLVTNQFAWVTLGGNPHRPAPMTIKTPDQTGDATAKLSIAFPRIVVGREFKQQLALVKASGSREPIGCQYALYQGVGTDLDAPVKTWDLYIGDASGIIFNGESVQVTATVDNPMRRRVGPVYDPGVFTGLELV